MSATFITSRLTNGSSPSGIEKAGLHEHARRHEERVARQEEADEEPGLGEDDRHEHRVATPVQKTLPVAPVTKKLSKDVDHADALAHVGRRVESSATGRSSP